MAQNMGSSQGQAPNPNAPQQGSGGGDGKKTMMLIAVALVALVVIAVIVIFASSGPSSAVITQTKSDNSSATYLGPMQAEDIIGAQLGNYNASDMFNPNAPVNMSFMVDLVPQLYNNVTSGWVTSAFSSDTTSNATLIYIVMQVNGNAAGLSKDLGSAVPYIVNGTNPIRITPGTYNGLNYTYGQYSNSTEVFQTLYGWKNNDLTLTIVNENAGYLVNQTALIDTVADTTP